MKENVCIIFGSKPNSELPKIKPSKIYSANAATAHFNKYIDIYGPIEKIAIVGSGAIQEQHVKRAVILSKPDHVIARRDKCNVKKYLGNDLPEAKLFNISTEKQYQFQKKHLGFKILMAELKYDKNPLRKLKRLYRHFIKAKSFGLSTGLFAALYASIENPHHDIILVGIGLQPGPHFYNISGFTNRAFVDNYMLPRFPKHIKDRFYTTDRYVSDFAGIKLWKGSTIGRT